MRTCKYCDINTSTKEDFCPGCGAPLPPLPPPPPKPPVQPQININTSTYQNYTSRNKSTTVSVILGIAFSLIFFIVVSIIVFTSQSSSKTRQTTFSSPAGSPFADDALILNEDFINSAQNQELTNSILQQALSKYFGKDFSKITPEEIDTIQFLYIQNKSLLISEQPMPESVSIFPWENTGWDFYGGLEDDIFSSETTNLTDLLEDEKPSSDVVEITFDGSFSDASNLSFLTGLKTLVIGSGSIYPNELDPMPHLQNLVVHSMYDTEDFTVFAKFPELTHLSVAGDDLVRTDGLSELTKLQKLDLYRTGLSNLGLISDMQNITALTLFDNDNLPNIQTLASMTWLKELHIEDVSYTDLNVIANMTQLERLTISDTKTKSVNFLSELTQLTYLYMDRNDNLITLPSLSGCTQLEEIYLDCYNIEDLSGLDGLSNVVSATLLSPDSLSFIASYTSLRHLELQPGWQLDVTPLSTLTDLEYLKMSEGSHSEREDDFSSLSNLSGLKELDLSSFGNHFHYDFVFDLVGLERLNLSNSSIFSDFNRIANLTNLQILHLDQIGFYSDYVIQSNGGFTTISYQGEQTFDSISASLSGLTNLKLLSIDKNEISDLSFVKDMTQLLVFSASDNYITDVSPLAGLTQLKHVNLTENTVENPSELDALINAYIAR